jgi:hypothetical protein
MKSYGKHSMMKWGRSSGPWGLGKNNDFCKSRVRFGAGIVEKEREC